MTTTAQQSIVLPAGAERDKRLLIAGLVVLAIAAKLAAGSLTAWEEDLFRAINNLSHRFELATWPLQQLGMALAIPVGALILRRLSGSWRKPAVLLLMASGIGWGLANMMRNAVSRGRPPSFLEGVQLGYDVPDAGPAFPSGHAIVVWALVVTFAPHVGRRTLMLMIGAALAVMVCRVYVGAHMPLDVIGGAAYGVAIGAATNLISSRLPNRTKDRPRG